MKMKTLHYLATAPSILVPVLIATTAAAAATTHLAADRPTDLAATAVPTAEVWIGSPVSGGKWASPCSSKPVYPSYDCSLPPWHWDLATYAGGSMNDGDWSVDLPVSGNRPVRLYVAPQNTSDVITAQIDSISDSCIYPAIGGKTVRVGVFKGTTRIGTLAFAHLMVSSSLRPGPVTRWGGDLGYVADNLPANPKCTTGTHVHMDFHNAGSGFSCYRNLPAGADVGEHEFIGFLGGSRVSTPRTRCP